MMGCYGSLQGRKSTEMKEHILYLDEKGILPVDRDDETSYSSRGYGVFHTSLSERLARYSEMCHDGKETALNQEAVKKVKERFHTDTGWVKAFSTASIYPAHGKKAGTTYNGVCVPVVLLHPALADIHTQEHELVHVIRNDIDTREDEDFAEAYAMSIKAIRQHHQNVNPWLMEQCWSWIDKSNKKLEDALGSWKGYVSIRMGKWETVYIADTPCIDIRKYLKSQKTLRHRIICERLGL